MLIQVLFDSIIAFIISVEWEVRYLVESEKGEGFDGVWGDVLARNIECDYLAVENPTS